MCFSCQAHVAAILVSAKADVNRATKRGAAPLLVATQKGYLEIVSTLLEGGADVNQAREGGATALVMACEKGHEDITRALIEHKAEVNHIMPTGETPLLAAASKGFVTVCRSLLAAGADSGVKMAGQTPLDWATKRCATPSLFDSAMTPEKAETYEECRDLLEAWETMDDSQREVVRGFGWEYYEKPLWTRSEHGTFPSHFRGQAVAVSLSMPDLPFELVGLLCGALDIHKRRRGPEGMEDVYYYNM